MQLHNQMLPGNLLTIDCSHDEADLRCIRCACEMRVDLFRLMLVQADESVEDVVAGGRIILAALVIREVVLHGADGELLLESIDLVQEQNDGRLDKPPRVADRVEQSQGFLHTVDRLILEQQLVVFRNGNQEENGSNVLKAVNPLLSL